MSCSIKLDPSAVTEAKLWHDEAKATQLQYEAAVRDLTEARKRIRMALDYTDSDLGLSDASYRNLHHILAGPLPPKAKAAAAGDCDEWGKRK